MATKSAVLKGLKWTSSKLVALDNAKFKFCDALAAVNRFHVKTNEEYCQFSFHCKHANSKHKSANYLIMLIKLLPQSDIFEISIIMKLLKKKKRNELSQVSPKNSYNFLSTRLLRCIILPNGNIQRL